MKRYDKKIHVITAILLANTALCPAYSLQELATTFISQATSTPLAETGKAILGGSIAGGITLTSAIITIKPSVHYGKRLKLPFTTDFKTNGLLAAPSESIENLPEAPS